MFKHYLCIPFIFIILIPSCIIPERDIIFDRSTEKATGQFINSLGSSPHTSAIKRIGVLKLKGDHNNHIRDLVMNRLMEIKGLEVLTTQDNEEMDTIISQYAKEMRKSYLYDDKDLLELGSFKGNRVLVAGSVQKTSIGIREGRVKLQLKVLDMKKGQILLSGLYEGSYFHPIQTQDFIFAVLLSIAVFIVLTVSVYAVGLHSIWSMWYGVILFTLLPFWLLVGRYLF